MREPISESFGVTSDRAFTFYYGDGRYVAAPDGAGRWRVDMPADTKPPFSCSYQERPANRHEAQH
jgi:hypothetical protein